jgi:hypothetical protein
MARRRGWKKGDWLVKDEESGFTEYGSRVAYDYYGVLKLKKQGDHLHPQDFIKPKDDPYPVTPVSEPLRDFQLDESTIGFFVDSTSIETPQGAALHLFRPGVDFAKLEYDLFVY